MNCICFRKGYKYQISEVYELNVEIKPDNDIITDFIELNVDGRLKIKVGYAWNGASDPAVDTLNFMRSSLVHDALYQLMREKKISRSHKETADMLLKNLSIEDGMSNIRAWWTYQAVKLLGNPATDPKNKRPYVGAPKGCTCTHITN